MQLVMKQNKILFTCFKPFGGREKNGSYEIVKNLGFDYVLLDVSFAEVDDFISKLDLDLDYLILVGEAIKREDITFEIRAKNIADGKDNKGVTKCAEKIKVDGKEYLYTNIKIPENFLISEDAGTYLCNYIYYSALDKFLTKKTNVIFIHLPDYCGKEEYLHGKMIDFLKETRII